MKIDIYSDIHMDSWLKSGWSEGELQFKPTKGTDVCVFAGDAGNGPEWYGKVMRLLRGRYVRVIGVPGNHDYYGSKAYGGILDLLAYDASNRIYKIADKTIATATFWTNFRNSETAKEMAFNSISDFRVIDGMTPEAMTILHNNAVNFLAEAASNQKIDVVVSHFPPIRNSEHPLYAGSSHLNPYFVNDCPELVEAIGASVWVHGHSHKKFDYDFKGTRVVANPTGYAMEEQNVPIFMPKQIEI